MKNTAKVALVAMLIWTTTALCQPTVTYVGEGRYACRGNLSECAVYNQRNALLEQTRRQLEQMQDDMRRNHSRSCSRINDNIICW